ncbi:hypothetical protein [Paenibacillus endoradicis]|uniref:hypothetical protein n=1 Tax=Paenibacillus endoradicis TaxID=2972487 RepID=UPI002158E9CB|nr:hypothetical protein [Paenibacillus endoradicis]MCR8659601.1 hypothetical protein [Paenibacillus endoradicis]
MQLFQMKDGSNETRLMKLSLEENYVSFGWKEIGDLENVSEVDFRSKALLSLNTVGTEQIEWMSQLEEITYFVYSMQDGDYIVIASDGFVYVGDVGDYYYVNRLDDGEMNSSHRRGVTWLKCVPIEQISEELQKFISQQANISKFDRLVSHELLNSWLEVNERNNDVQASLVDMQTIEEALIILKTAMHSDDVERRERAAIAILQYAK